jgi:hypothetical protein
MITFRRKPARYYAHTGDTGRIFINDIPFRDSPMDICVLDKNMFDRQRTDHVLSYVSLLVFIKHLYHVKILSCIDAI